ncbi:MAG: response regulator [Candidatus Helarchaeota archaeon]
MSKICVIDDEKSICETLKWILEKEGHVVSYARTIEDAEKLIKKRDFDLYFVDLILPGGSGIQIIKKIVKYNKNSIIIVITGYPNIPTLVDSMRLDVYDYLSKPIDPSELKKIVNFALSPHKISGREKNE